MGRNEHLVSLKLHHGLLPRPLFKRDEPNHGDCYIRYIRSTGKFFILHVKNWLSN
jgi:hypothetical protein